MNTVGQWLEQAQQRLVSADQPGSDSQSARLDADLLAEHVTGKSRASLFAFPERPLTAVQLVLLETLLLRRCEGEPLAYITGEREFWSLPLQLDQGALVPRPDTELLVEQALSRLPELPEGNIVELGTGSGAIAVALAQELMLDRQIVAVERHTAAMQVAKANVRRFGRDRVLLVQGSWLDSMADNCAALIISNPPYLASNDPHLPALLHEPQTALVSGPNGLEDIAAIISAARRVGKDGSLLLLEHGHEQGPAVRSLLENHHFCRIQTERDLAGHERVSLGYWMGGVGLTSNAGNKDQEKKL